MSGNCNCNVACCSNEQCNNTVCCNPCCNSQINLSSGIQVQLINSAEGLLENSSNVIFNSITNLINSSIYYNHFAGEFILPAKKNYFITWWVAVDGTAESCATEFALVADSMTVAISSSPQVTCQLTGSTIVAVGETQKTISLKNVSGSTAKYAATATQANLVIIELAC